jgi:hypothetical protein
VTSLIHENGGGGGSKSNFSVLEYTVFFDIKNSILTICNKEEHLEYKHNFA